MTRIRFEDLPSTNTPRNAENLNKLNNVVISSTEPNTGEELWIQKSSNLYKGTLESGLWISGSKIGANSSGWYTVCPIEGGKTYTISKKNTTGVIYCTTTTDYPKNNVSIVDSWQGSSGIQTLTYTTSNSAKYLFIGLFAGTPTSTQQSECIEELMVNLGSSALPYDAYIDKKIYVKNESDIYELLTETVHVGTEEGASRVNFIKGKNLFDKDNANVLDAYFSTSDTAITSSTYNKTLFIPCKPNTTYTYQSASGVGLTNSIGYTTSYPTIGMTVSGIISQNNPTITTGNNAKYLLVRFFQTINATITYQQALDSIQIEENSTATTLEPYVTPAIVVDGEEIYNKNNLEIYSTEETRIGTWINGKPLYRKVFTGAMPIVETDGTFVVKYIEINSLNVDVVFFDNPFFMGYPSGSKSIQSLPSLSQNNMSQGALISVWNTNVEIRSNRTVWNTFTYYVPLIYTKTTD